jgi:hypothetical protein
MVEEYVLAYSFKKTIKLIFPAGFAILEPIGIDKKQVNQPNDIHSSNSRP